MRFGRVRTSITPSKFAMQVVPESTMLLLKMQRGLEEAFGKGSVAIVGSTAMNLNRAVTGQAVEDGDVIRKSGDVDFMLMNRLSDKKEVNQFTVDVLNTAGFKLSGELVSKIYASEPPRPAGAYLSAGIAFEGITVELLNEIMNIPARPVVLNAYTETYTRGEHESFRLTFATIPFLIVTKCEPSGKIRREKDVEVIRGMLETYYEGSLATFFEKERASLKAVSRHISTDFRQGLFESLQKK